MSKIKKVVAKETTSWVDYPEIDGFKVELVYLNREDLMKIRNRALTYKFNKRTRQREEEIDNDKFLEGYAEKAIRNWSGLKAKHLPDLLPADISDMDPEEDIEYDEEDAVELLKNSTVFDQFITDCMNDYESFSKKKVEEDVKN
jgi:hypothetical protein